MYLLQFSINYADLYKIFNITADISSYTTVALALFGLFFSNRFHTFYKWLLYNIVITAIIELINIYLMEKLKLPNTQFVSYIYMFLEVFMFGMFYYSIIENKSIKKLHLFTFTILLIFIIANAFYKQGYLEIPSKTALVEMILFSAVSIFIFFEISQKRKISKLRKQPLFIFNLFVFAFFFSNVLFFVFIDFAFKVSQNLGMMLYIVRNVISLLCYSLWIYATLQLPANIKTTFTKTLKN